MDNKPGNAMTEAAARTTGSQRTLNHDPSGADFQAAIRRATVARAIGQGGRPGSQSSGKPGAVQTGSAYRASYTGADSPVSAQTGVLIEDALRLDKEGDPHSPESARRWRAVQEAIAGEVRPMLATHSKLGEDPLQGPQFSTELTTKLQKINSWAGGDDPLAQSTKGAFDLMDVDLRKQLRDRILDDTIGEVKDDSGEVEEINDDHNIFRKGWEGMFGGASEDFEDFVDRKVTDLEDFDKQDDGLSDEQYEKRLTEIIGNYDVDLKKYSKDLAESDETWHTVGEVGRVVAATTVGIATTAASGGQFWLGFAAAALTYEAIDGYNDVFANAGEDVYADGHVAITTGIADLLGLGVGGDGFGMSSDHLKTWAVDNSVDLISSAATAGATKIGMAAGGGTAKWLGAGQSGLRATIGGSQLGTRVAATTVGGTSAQFVNGVGFLASDATRLGFDGKLFTAEGGQQLENSAWTQGKYLVAAAPTSAVAGLIPLYRLAPAPAAAAPAAAAPAAGQPTAPAYRLNYVGVTGQLTNDTVSNLATTYWATNGHMTKADTIAALGSVLPGTFQNVVVRPDTQERINAWRPVKLDTQGQPKKRSGLGQKDLKLLPSTEIPPARMRVAPIAAFVTTVRALLATVDGATGWNTQTWNTTKIANDLAIPLTALRSSLSKAAWHGGNWRLNKVYQLAFEGKKTEALDLLTTIEARRKKYGMKPTEKPGTDTTARAQVDVLGDLGIAYRDLRAALENKMPGFGALLPDINIRSLRSPSDVFAKLQNDPRIPAELRSHLQTFDPDTRVLENSNIVEGLITDPNFLINGLQALAKKLKPSDIEEMKLIFDVQKLLEADVSDHGYDNTQGLKWSDLLWKTEDQPGSNKPAIFDAEIKRLTEYADKFARIFSGDPHVKTELTGIMDAWQAYVLLYGRVEPNAPASNPQPRAVVDARADYQVKLDNIPPKIRGALPNSQASSLVSPRDFLAKLLADKNTSVELREALEFFSPNTRLMESPEVVRSLLNDPQLMVHTIDALQHTLKPQQIESIKLLIEVRDQLKASPTEGGYNHLTPDKTWNEAVWRIPPGEPRDKPAIVDEELQKLDTFVNDFLSNTARDANGNEQPGARELLGAWNAYLALYSQAQHDLPASGYKPGIDHKKAEQTLGSSASPNTGRGYLLKAAAYGVALNLFYSWALKATPDTNGVLQGYLLTAYAFETGLALYNPWGQTGYAKALGAMTDFKALYTNEAQYKPSDIPKNMDVFDPVLARKFNKLEEKRQFWNKISDWGSVVSALRNGTMGAAFFKMGFPELGLLASANGLVSAGWFLSQRTPPLQKLQTFLAEHPGYKATARRLSIYLGPILATLVMLQTWNEQEEISKKQGNKGGSFADQVNRKLEEFIDFLIEDDDAKDLPISRNPLPDRA